LSGDEVTATLGVQVKRASEGLIGYWRCDDASGTTVKDYSVGFNDGTIQGSSPDWVRAGWRESPSWDLGIIPHHERVAIASIQSVPGSTSIVTQATIDDGVTWQTITGVTALTGLIEDADLQGTTLRVRQFLKSTDVAVTPYVSALFSFLRYRRAVGDLVIAPELQFASLRSASIASIQNSGPAGWTLVAKTIHGARFLVYTPSTGVGLDALVDVVFRGGRVVA
jgi:hypothetical protein